MMEDDNKSTASTSTEFSTGSSVGSNTPSLVGENLESFCLGETEKNGPNEGMLVETEHTSGDKDSSMKNKGLFQPI